MAVTYLAIFLFSIFFQPISAISQDCSPKESVILQGKCSLYVNDLMFLTEEESVDEVTLDYAKNVSAVCQKITNCFGDIQCADAQRNKELYEQKCEKMDYTNYGLVNCLTKFYEIVDDKLVKCTEEFDYVSNDMSTLRKAYTTGKTCFMDLVKSNCNPKAFAYLNSNYDSFLNVLTVPPKSGKCSSVHDGLIALRCLPLQEKLKTSMGSMGLRLLMGGSNTTKTLSNTCKKLEDCMEESCLLSASNTTAQVKKLCLEMDSKLGALEFPQCLITIMFANLTSYECVPSNATISIYLDVNTNSNFYDDKECAKKIMVGECGQGVTIGFDQNWDKLVESKKKPKNSTRLNVEDFLI